jgi:UDP-glucuronate 4-epimerase
VRLFGALTSKGATPMKATSGRYLVTGCAGFIGSHLTESLLNDGAEVVGVDCFNNNYGRADKLRNLERARQWDAFEFVPIDLARGELADLVADCDVVFHLAAEPGVRSSWGSRFEAYLRNNLQATQHLLDAARQWPDKRFVYASSSSIYGEAETFPTREDALPAPFSPYGMTKLAAEHLCQTYLGNFGVQTVSLRFFSVYGPRQRPDMAFNRFCRAALEGNPITVYGDGEQTRDFTFVADVVAATRAAAFTDGVVGQVYNIGGGSRVSVNQAIDLLEHMVDGDLDVVRMERERGDVKNTGGDTTKAQRDLGFSPSVEFAEGLAAEFDWTKAQIERESAAVAG